MHGSTATHPLFPIGTEWIVTLSESEKTVQAFDAETLRRLFTGSYIAPKEYRKRDPREWSDRTFKRLLNRHGLYGGSRLGSEVFILAEILAMRVLMKTTSRADRSDLERMPLAEALQVSRDVYADFVTYHLPTQEDQQVSQRAVDAPDGTGPGSILVRGFVVLDARRSPTLVGEVLNGFACRTNLQS